MRVNSAWRLVRARTMRRVRSGARKWRGSLQVRVITTTMAIGLVALAVIGGYVSHRMRDGLFTHASTRCSRRARGRRCAAQATFDASTATSGTDVQRLLHDVGASRSVQAARASVRCSCCGRPGRRAAASSVTGAASDPALVDLVSPELKAATATGGQHWQSVAWPVDDRRGAGGHGRPGRDRARRRHLPAVLPVQPAVGAGPAGLPAAHAPAGGRRARRPARQHDVAGDPAGGPPGAPCRARWPNGSRTVTCRSGCRSAARTRWRRWRARSTRWPRACRTRSAAWRSSRRSSAGSSRTCRTSCGRPLTTVRMAGEVIYTARDGFDPAVKRSAELLQTQLDRFEELLADLLEISRFDAGAAVLEAGGLRRARRRRVGRRPRHAARGAPQHLAAGHRAGEAVRRGHRPTPGRADPAQPAGQRDRARRGHGRRGDRRRRRARGRGDRPGPRGRHDPERGASTSSTGSGGPTRPGRAPRAGPGSVWPSRSRTPTCTAAGWRRGVDRVAVRASD